MNQYLVGRNIHMRNYTLANVQEAYKTLFASVRTGIGNPMVRPGTSRGIRGTKRSFYLFEAGEYEGEEGYWAEDEDTNEEGFLSTENETFWTLDEAKDEWHEANVAGRKIKRRGKGKGKSRKRFQSKKRGKFRPHRNTGRAHVANDDQYWYSGQWDEQNAEGFNDTLFEKGKGYGWKSGKRGKKGKDKDEKGGDAFKGWFKGYSKGKFKKGKNKSHIAQSGDGTGDNANQPAEGEASGEGQPYYAGEYYEPETGIIWYTSGSGEHAGQQWADGSWSSFIVQEIMEREKTDEKRPRRVSCRDRQMAEN